MNCFYLFWIFTTCTIAWKRNRITNSHPWKTVSTKALKSTESDTTSFTPTSDSYLRKNVELYDKYGGLAESGSVFSPVDTAEVVSSISALSNNNHPLLTTKPEVLAPAGGWSQLRAAVANGADAVYFGLQVRVGYSNISNYI